MTIRKKSFINPYHTDYFHLRSPLINENINANHTKSIIPTNNNLVSITLEDCDKGVFAEFNNKFLIGVNLQPVIKLDSELVGFKEKNYTQFDVTKDALNGPYLTMFRTRTETKYKSNPTIKDVISIEPKQKKNGIVYEETIISPSLWYDLIYEFKFITGFRKYANQFEEQLRYYFRNKRNIINVNGTRFSIGPVDYNKLITLELLNQDNQEEKNFYISTVELKLECFIRDASTIQKRERKNTFVTFVEAEGEVISEEEVTLTDIYPSEPEANKNLLPSTYFALVNTLNASNITRVSFNINSEITSLGNSNLLEKGVCFSSTNSLPTISIDGKVISNQDSTNFFTVGIINLTPFTNYYVRSYVTTNHGTSYGNLLKVKTTI